MDPDTLFGTALKTLGDIRNPSRLLIDFKRQHVIELQRSGIVNTDLFLQFADAVNWKFVSRYIAMSEDVIRRLANFVDWETICQCQTLTEEFMTEFMPRMHDISRYQNVSAEFARRHHLTFFRRPLDWSEMDIIDMYNENKSNQLLVNLLQYQPHVSEQALLDNIQLEELQHCAPLVPRSYSIRFFFHIFGPVDQWTNIQWERVVRHNRLPKNVILAYKRNLNPALILATQDLDQELIDVFLPRVIRQSARDFSTHARDLDRFRLSSTLWDREAVSLRDDLTPEFCIQNMHRLVGAVLKCRNFPHEFFETCRNQLSDMVIGRYAPQTYIQANLTPGILQWIDCDVHRFSLRFIFDHFPNRFIFPDLLTIRL